MLATLVGNDVLKGLQQKDRISQHAHQRRVASMSAERLSQLRADPSTGEPANDTESRRHAGMGRIHAHPLESAALSRRTPEADAQHLPTDIAESTALVG
jgi:hypothetical protein